MPIHPFDFEINPHVYSTPEFELLFAEKSVYQRWLDFEAALAEAQGKYGVIPVEAAQVIKSRAKLEHIDLEKVKVGYGKSRNSVVPFLAGLRRSCEEYGDFVHFGATTQDVLDTGQILALQKTMSLLYRDLRSIEKVILDLSNRYRKTPMAARTHGQQALPTTFGLKTIGWAAEIRRHLERLLRLFDSVNQGQLSGAVGTFAALGNQGIEVAGETMALLGLKHNPLAWHTSRDTLAELGAVFSMLVMTMAKIGNEIIQLQKTEIGELVEPSISGALASSTMPHKRNPVICQRVVALSRHVRAMAGTIMESMGHEHERDPRCLWAEWLAIPQLCIYTGSTLHSMLNVLSGLTVNTDRMLSNLHMHKELISTEWLLFKLSETLGKTRAQKKLHSLASAAVDGGLNLKESLLQDSEIGTIFKREDLELLDHPEKYLGEAVRIVDITSTEIMRRRKVDPEMLV